MYTINKVYVKSLKRGDSDILSLHPVSILLFFFSAISIENLKTQDVKTEMYDVYKIVFMFLKTARISTMRVIRNIITLASHSDDNTMSNHYGIIHLFNRYSLNGRIQSVQSKFTTAITSNSSFCYVIYRVSNSQCRCKRRKTTFCRPTDGKEFFPVDRQTTCRLDQINLTKLCVSSNMSNLLDGFLP